MTEVDKKLKDVQTIVNARHYKQYILPLVQTIEETNQKVEIIKIKKSIENIITSSLSQLENQVEIINGEQYIKLECVNDVIKKELQIYT